MTPAALRTELLMIYYVFLVLSLALTALGLLLRRRSDSLGRLMMILGALGCAGCIAWQVRENLFAPPAPGPDRGEAVVAYFLANQVLAEAGDRQGPIVLFFPPGNVFDEETVGTYMGTFSRVLRGFAGLQVQPITLNVSGKAAAAGQIPLAAFQQAATNASGTVACVSFAGVPADIEVLLADPARPAPAYFVFDPWGTTNWLAALKHGRVRAVIVPRPGADRKAGSEIAGEPNEIFTRLYLMATPATADRVAAQLGVK